MDKGKIVVQGTPDELKRSVGNDVITIELVREDAGIIKRLRAIPNVKKVIRDGLTLKLYVKDVDKGIITLMQQFNETDVASIQIKRPTLDDVFFQATGHKYEVA
jgi:ABC-2 type transport system ATP-binding protein